MVTIKCIDGIKIYDEILISISKTIKNLIDDVGNNKTQTIPLDSYNITIKEIDDIITLYKDYCIGKQHIGFDTRYYDILEYLGCDTNLNLCEKCAGEENKGSFIYWYKHGYDYANYDMCIDVLRCCHYDCFKHIYDLYEHWMPLHDKIIEDSDCVWFLLENMIFMDLQMKYYDELTKHIDMKEICRYAIIYGKIDIMKHFITDKGMMCEHEWLCECLNDADEYGSYDDFRYINDLISRNSTSHQ